MVVASLVVGRVYFQATYEDPKLSRPVILSFEYLGKDIHGEPSMPEDSYHYFNFLPPFRAMDENGQEIEENVLHMFTEEHASALLDFDGLLAELASRREAWPGRAASCLRLMRSPPNYSFKRTAATGSGTIMRRSAAAA